jgi:ketosteroid isomerase-like protein
MSEENVEIVRRLFEEMQAGLEHGDPGAWLESEAVADEYEWVVPIPFEGKSVWKGREEVVEFIRTWMDEFENYSVRLERLIDAGDDRVVLIFHQRATGKGSGAPVEWHLGQVLELEDGRLIRTRNYFDRSEALEVAGLHE